MGAEGGCSALPVIPSGPGELFEASSAPAWPWLRWVRLWAGGPEGGPSPLPAESGDRPSPHSTCPPRVHILPRAQTLASPSSPSPLTGTGAEPRRGLTGEWTGLSAQASGPAGGVYITLSSGLGVGWAPGPGGGGEGSAAKLTQTSGCSPPSLAPGPTLATLCAPARPEPWAPWRAPPLPR